MLRKQCCLLQAAEKLLKTGLFSDGSLYRPSSPSKGSLSPLHSRSASGGWQPASRSSTSSRSPSASPPVSLRAMLKQVCASLKAEMLKMQLQSPIRQLLAFKHASHDELAQASSSCWPW